MTDFSAAKELFAHGVQCLERNDFARAEEFFVQALAIAPRSIPCRANLAIACFRQKKYDGAERAARRIAAIDPRNVEAYSMIAACCQAQGRHQEAAAVCLKITEIDPAHVEAYNNRGLSLTRLGHYADAAKSFERATEIRPDLAEAWLGRGNVLTALRHYDEALADYDRALALQPGLPGAWSNRGQVLNALRRHDEASAAYDRALALAPDLAEAWLGRGHVLADRKRHDEAFAAYDQALALKPDLAEAWLGRGNALADLKRHDEAAAAFDRALALKPDLAEAWLGRGIVAADRKRHADALVAFDRAVALKPGLAEAWLGRGQVFAELRRYDEALVAYDRALALDAKLTGAAGPRLQASLHCCDWSAFERDCDRLFESLRNDGEALFPFALLAVGSSPEQQLSCARSVIARSFPQVRAPLWRGEIYQHDKIRIGYVSADFHEHATAYLTAGLFEGHDRQKFDLAAFSFGPDDRSAMRRRLQAAFDQFLDLRGAGNEQIAAEIRRLEIDILIDLKGFTQDSRVGIFADRPAPLQVNYLGFPGTMGADYIDYIVADATLITEPDQRHYSEKVVRLPHSYQPNDRARSIAATAFSREQCGLPPTGFVYCCFNNNYKITPSIFDSWMRILGGVDHAVLWLIEDYPTAAANLRREAARRGIEPGRIVFAGKLPLSEHLARHRLADLFLDTLPYNAHTTASDALWAGLPVLTERGATFAGRVAASLLKAVDLPELIATSRQQYEAQAIELARNRAELQAIKQKLAARRLTAPLFDTGLFARHIEAAYTAIYRRYREGLPPDHIDIGAEE